MFDAIQIMSGYREIKDEFRVKCRILRPAHELALWFTFDGALLYVHDWEDHKISMLIAVNQGDRLELRLRPGFYGEKLVRKAFIEKPHAPHEVLNDEYRLAGLIPFRLV